MTNGNSSFTLLDQMVGEEGRKKVVQCQKPEINKSFLISFPPLIYDYAHSLTQSLATKPPITTPFVLHQYISKSAHSPGTEVSA